jgi:Xaa-Pro aminopeptidase
MKNKILKPKKLSSSEKLSRMKKAIKLTQIGLTTARKKLRAGITEIQLAASIENSMRLAGATWFAFPSIVCSSKFINIHATPSKRKIRASDTVIVDIGAQYKGVCADMTRTFCLYPTKKTHDLYNLVKRAHDESAKFLGPRVRCSLIDKIARQIISKAGYKIPHGLGHGVGVKVHERPSLKPRSQHILKIGDVVTIEPGVYLSNRGVRIEDMYLITKKGAKKLTNFPRKL